MKLSALYREIQRVKDYVRLMLPEKPVRSWSVIRYSIDIVLCYKLYGASMADYFELRFLRNRTGKGKPISLRIRL